MSNNKKRKYFEIESEDSVEILSRKIVKISFNNKRKEKEVIENIPKYRKLEKCNKLPKETVYVCFKHDHNKDNCTLYDCDGFKENLKEEDYRKYYIY